jgi:hypothetical protein
MLKVLCDARKEVSAFVSPPTQKREEEERKGHKNALTYVNIQDHVIRSTS